MPPRFPEDMSLRESREDDFASPLRARSLLTVRAAISFARLVEAPRFLAPSLTCSYCRSRLLLHADCGIRIPPHRLFRRGVARLFAFLCARQHKVLHAGPDVVARTSGCSRYSSGGFCTLCSVAYSSTRRFTTSNPSAYA